MSELPEDAKPVGFAESTQSANPEQQVCLREPINVRLKDGRLVGMAEPTKFAPSQFVHSVLKDKVFQDLGSRTLEEMRVSSLLYVTDIDMKTQTSIKTDLDRLLLEQTLGVLGVQAVFKAYCKHFPDITDEETEIIKK